MPKIVIAFNAANKQTNKEMCFKYMALGIVVTTCPLQTLAENGRAGAGDKRSDVP